MARMVTNSHETCFLEIGIPTYNRSQKLERLLTILEQEVQLVPEEVSIRITISDNHSSDATRAMLQRHSFRDSVVVRVNAENMGALRNIWGLYETSRAQYIWIHSDDDIPKSGSVKKIVDVLLGYEPTVLTFEFEQPLGSQVRRHGAKNGIEQISDMSQAIPYILALGKLTKYVTDAKNLQTALASVGHFRDTGYGWQAVILEVLQLSTLRTITIIHEFLASCDDQYTKLLDELTPQYWEDQTLLLDHEIVSAYCPDYSESIRRGHSRYMVMMIYGVMAGAMQTCNRKVFGEYGRQLPFNISFVRNPIIGLEWVSLRFGLPAFRIVSDMASVMASVLGYINIKLTSLFSRNQKSQNK